MKPIDSYFLLAIARDLAVGAGRSEAKWATDRFQYLHSNTQIIYHFVARNTQIEWQKATDFFSVLCCCAHWTKSVRSWIPFFCRCRFLLVRRDSFICRWRFSFSGFYLSLFCFLFCFGGSILPLPEAVAMFTNSANRLKRHLLCD